MFALRLQRVAQVAIGRGVGAVAQQRTRYQLLGLPVPALLIGDHPQKMQGVDVLRVQLQHLSVQRLGLLQAPRLMLLQGQADLLRGPRRGRPPDRLLAGSEEPLEHMTSAKPPGTRAGHRESAPDAQRPGSLRAVAFSVSRVTNS